MEMIPLFIYLAGVVEQIGTGTTVVCVLLTIALALTFMYLHGEEYRKNLDDSDRNILGARWRLWKTGLLCLILCFIISILSPNSKTMYALIGTYGAVQIVQSPESKVLIEKSFKVINQKLDEILDSGKVSEEKK